MKNIDEFINIGQYLDIGTIPVLTAIFIVFLLLLVWKRTNSTHSIMSKLWRIFNGKNLSGDFEINKILSERSALMEFRFTTGIPIRLRSQIQPLITWGSKNNEDLDDIAKCGYLFDFEKPGLKKVSKAKRMVSSIILLFMLVFLSFGTMLTTAMATTNKALLKITASGNWILMGNETAKRISIFSGESYANLDTENCSYPILKIIERTKLEEDDISMLCDSLKKGTHSKLIKNTIDLQRIIFIPMNVPLYFIIAILFTILLNISSTNKMERRIKAREILNNEDYSI